MKPIRTKIYSGIFSSSNEDSIFIEIGNAIKFNDNKVNMEVSLLPQIFWQVRIPIIGGTLNDDSAFWLYTSKYVIPLHSQW